MALNKANEILTKEDQSINKEKFSLSQKEKKDLSSLKADLELGTLRNSMKEEKFRMNIVGTKGEKSSQDVKAIDIVRSIGLHFSSNLAKDHSFFASHLESDKIPLIDKDGNPSEKFIEPGQLNMKSEIVGYLQGVMGADIDGYFGKGSATRAKEEYENFLQYLNMEKAISPKFNIPSNIELADYLDSFKKTINSTKIFSDSVIELWAAKELGIFETKEKFPNDYNILKSTSYTVDKYSLTINVSNKLKITSYKIPIRDILVMNGNSPEVDRNRLIKAINNVLKEKIYGDYANNLISSYTKNMDKIYSSQDPIDERLKDLQAQKDDFSYKYSKFAATYSPAKFKEFNEKFDSRIKMLKETKKIVDFKEAAEKALDEDGDIIKDFKDKLDDDLNVNAWKEFKDSRNVFLKEFKSSTHKSYYKSNLNLYKSREEELKQVYETIQGAFNISDWEKI